MRRQGGGRGRREGGGGGRREGGRVCVAGCKYWSGMKNGREACKCKVSIQGLYEAGKQVVCACAYVYGWMERKARGLSKQPPTK